MFTFIFFSTLPLRYQWESCTTDQTNCLLRVWSCRGRIDIWDLATTSYIPKCTDAEEAWSKIVDQWNTLTYWHEVKVQTSNRLRYGQFLWCSPLKTYQGKLTFLDPMSCMPKSSPLLTAYFRDEDLCEHFTGRKWQQLPCYPTIGLRWRRTCLDWENKMVLCISSFCYLVPSHG